MLALICAALTFCIVFWAVWELGQPWRRFGTVPSPLFSTPHNYVVAAIEGEGDRLHVTYQMRS